MQTQTDRRIIDFTESQLRDLIAGALLTMPVEAPRTPPDVLDRAGAAALLGVSLSKLDGLARAETDPLPFYRVGDVRRFLRADLLEWVRAHRAN
jgi:excisionase family DNA binding protein